MRKTLLFGTPFSKQASLLRATLLLSLGLSPLACGGTVVTHSGESGTGGAGPVVGTAGAAAAAGAGATAGTGPVVHCENPMVSPLTGLVACDNGVIHRPGPTSCGLDDSAGGTSYGADDSAGAGGTAGAATVGSYCITNADCASIPRGYCDRGGMPECRSGCSTDSDCGNTAVCVCGDGNPGRCVGTGDCSVDADCGPDSLCAFASGVCGGGSFHCLTTKDECTSNADCGEWGTCAYEGAHRACSHAVCGRPFLVEEQARMAAVEARTDWLDATLAPDPCALSPIERAQLAAHWARLGQMEHASIAAFARFNLQLLSLGAPNHLVEACNRALADETAHARSCFALASAYGGHAVGPARLDIEHCFEDTSLVAIAKLVLREGCLGETVAALEAVAAAEAARDSTVKQTLTRIAHDELNHAELAFQFLRWALSVSSAEERHELACEAAQQLADFESEARNGERSPTNDRLAAHGLLGSDALRVIHLAAAKDVSRPLLAALFDLEGCSLV